MKLKINPEYEKILPKMQDEEYEALKKSIEEKGLQYPIIHNSEGVILDGHNRYRICMELGIVDFKTERRYFTSKLEEKEFVVLVNLERRHLNNFQKAEMGMVLLEVEKELSKQRKLEHAKSNEPITSNEVKGMSTRIVASKIGLSGATFERAKKVIDDGKEDLKQKCREGKISIGAAYIQVIREERHINTPELPKGEFDVIYADPPWKYDFSLEGDSREKYPTMDTSNICTLSIPSAKDSILFLWVTNPKIEDAIKVIKAWGFKYITNLVWVKQTKGLGYYSMAQHELLFICKKGNMPPPQAENRPLSAIHADRTEHSKKPEVFYEIIEKMYPNRKYLELFARSKRNGWVSWGNEV